MKPAKTIVEQLRRGWCACAMAMDEAGRPVAPYEASAIRWCPIGAAVAVYRDGRSYHLPVVAQLAMNDFAADHEYASAELLNDAQPRLNKLILDCARAGDRAAQKARRAKA